MGLCEALRCEALHTRHGLFAYTYRLAHVPYRGGRQNMAAYSNYNMTAPIDEGVTGYCVAHTTPKSLTLAGDSQPRLIAIRFPPARIRGEEDPMGQALKITRTEQTAEALREFAAKSRDGAQVRRLLAIALILEGDVGPIAGAGPVAPSANVTGSMAMSR
jgi:hypothetical protein